MITPWMKPIEDASVWSGKDLERDQSWRFSLTPQQVAELDDGLRLPPASVPGDCPGRRPTRDDIVF